MATYAMAFLYGSSDLKAKAKAKAKEKQKVKATHHKGRGGNQR
jgi:hypothetical protein